MAFRSIRLCVPIVILYLLQHPVSAQTRFTTIDVGASVTAGGDGNASRWLSPSGDFAFGFRPLEKDLFLLAIWFDKVRDETVAWHAGDPAPRGSRAELRADRGLVLASPSNQELWNTEPIITQVGFATLGDTGNLAISGNDSDAIWESFKNPTDTLLPGQALERGGVVSSRSSGSNFSRGRFQLSLLRDGNLVLNSVNLPSEFTNENYYESGTNEDSSSPGFRLEFNESGSLFVRRQKNDTFVLTGGFAGENYYRVTLNFDGVLTEYSHPKNGTNSGWSPVWSKPDNICIASLVYKSSGACGYNRICRVNSDKRPVCECPRGFSLLDAGDEYRGCKPNFMDSCQNNSRDSARDLYAFEEIMFIDWPTSDYEALQPSDAEKCKEACMHDCMCAVAILRNYTCWKKKIPLSNGRINSDDKATAFIKVRKSNSPERVPSSSNDNNQNAVIIAGSVLLGTSVLVNFLLVGGIFTGIFFIYRRNYLRPQQARDVSRLNLRCFSYRDLSEITHGFKEELGRGSFGIVYKGLLKDTNEHVAVKKLDRSFNDSEKEFKAEVNVIGHTHHKNLVRLVGFCEEREHRLLVYEFMSNGTLAGLLFGELKPSWSQRIHVAVGVAKGLLYLHEECTSQIIHCDIKPQNILLDEFYTARIADFGLAKLLMMNQSHTNTAIRGTKGYVAPEWFSNMPVTAKVDVYSYGVLLLEIICCRRNVETETGTEKKAILVYWACDCYREGSLEALAESDVEIAKDLGKFERLLRIGIWCIQDDPSLRPTMKEVLLMLEGVVQVSDPPSPFLITPTAL